MITFSHLGQLGRMGNQMFQYATLYSVAMAKNYDFGVPFDKKSNNEYFNFCLNECFSHLSARSCKNTNVNYYKEKDFCFDSSIFDIPNNTDLYGYFQSEKYFIKYKQDILREFTFNEEIIKISKNIKSQFNNPTVSVHIRLGDYLNPINKTMHPIPDIKYYQNSMDIMPKDLKYIIFSDDIFLAKNILKSIDKNFIYIDTKNKYVDMCLMTLCDYHIIANSTFSWWGAWLADSKLVIAPKKWFGESPNAPKKWSDIYCNGWITL